MRERGQGRIFQRGNFWWIQYYHRGRQIRVSAGETEGEAKKLLKKRLAEVETNTHSDSRNIRYEELRAVYYQDYVVNERKSLRRDKEGRPHLDKVARLDDFFAGCRASEINADLIRKFIEDQRAKGLSNGSINRSLSALKHMFRLAKQDEKLQHVPHFPMTPEADPRPGYLEREQYDKLFAELPAYLRLPLALGYYSGMRLGEVLGLQWLRKDEKGVPREQVDFLHGVIHLEAFETKSNEARDIPIVSQLRTLLLEQREKNRKAHCPYVCFRLDPRGDAVKIVGFRRAWQSACIRAGLGSMVPEVDSETGEVLYAK